MIFQGIRTSIAKKPYIFVIFQGGPSPLSTHLDPHMFLTTLTRLAYLDVSLINYFHIVMSFSQTVIVLIHLYIDMRTYDYPRKLVIGT